MHHLNAYLLTQTTNKVNANAFSQQRHPNGQFVIYATTYVAHCLALLVRCTQNAALHSTRSYYMHIYKIYANRFSKQ